MQMSFWRARLFGVNALIPSLLLALIVLIGFSLTPDPYRTQLHALQLLIISSIYIGFAVNDGRPREVAIEIVAFLAFVGVSLLGLWGSPYWTIGGYIAHGVWDLLHHERGIQTVVVRWYPPVCVLYDWIFAAVLLADMLWV